MSTDTLLSEKKAELKDAITRGIEYTIPAYFFNLVGDAMARTLRLERRPPWAINAFVLGLLLFLPGLLISIATGEIHAWGELDRFYLALAVAAYCSPIVSFVNMGHNVLPAIRDHIVNSIDDVEDLKIFSIWLSPFWSIRKWSAINIVIGIPYFTFINIAESYAAEKFIGFGLLTINFMLAFLFTSPLYVLYKMLTLPPLLARFKLELYESDPVNSEVIQRLVQMLNIYLYYVAGYLAVLTWLGVQQFIAWLLWLNVLLGWLPTISQFLVNQYAIRKIVVAAKWRSLNRIQTHIKELQEGNLNDVPESTITRIGQLMDLHDRINAKRNSTLDLGTGLSFLNQMLLPLLGLLLGSIDRVLSFFKP